MRFSWRDVAGFIAIATLVGIVCFLVPSIAGFDTPDTGSVPPAVKGTIQRVVDERQEDSPRGRVTFRELEVDLDDGGLVEVNQQIAAADASALGDAEEGDRVLLERAEGPQGEQYFIVDYVRELPLLVLALAFAALVLVIGRWHGLWSIAGMGVSFLVILEFILPGILSGQNAPLIALAGGLTIMVATLYLAHGITRKTTVALAGTVAALLLTVALAEVSVGFAELSGLAEENAATVAIVTGGGVDASGLLLAGMIIGALGVLDDVTIAQASAVFELREANAALGGRELYRRGMNIGRDHIASTVNTLVLAYAGASLPLLVLLATQAEPLGTLVNREFLATEIVRTLVGSIGIVAAVPLTTGLAALAASRRRRAGMEEPAPVGGEAPAATAPGEATEARQRPAIPPVVNGGLKPGGRTGPGRTSIPGKPMTQQELLESLRAASRRRYRR